MGGKPPGNHGAMNLVKEGAMRRKIGTGVELPISPRIIPSAGPSVLPKATWFVARGITRSTIAATVSARPETTRPRAAPAMLSRMAIRRGSFKSPSQREMITVKITEKATNNKVKTISHEVRTPVGT